MQKTKQNWIKPIFSTRGASDREPSMSEALADISSHSGKMIMTIFAGIAKSERDLIRERTGAAREAAIDTEMAFLQVYVETRRTTSFCLIPKSRSKQF